jgi:hypothetical protein
MYRSLKRRDRWDLIEKLRERKGQGKARESNFHNVNGLQYADGRNKSTRVY